jgi:hypothetical protein
MFTYSPSVDESAEGSGLELRLRWFRQDSVRGQFLKQVITNFTLSRTSLIS